jgi:hypothetical protein
MEMQKHKHKQKDLCPCRALVAEAVAVAEGNSSRQAVAPVVCRRVVSRWEGVLCRGVVPMVR